jgi:hypothetical protein
MRAGPPTMLCLQAKALFPADAELISSPSVRKHNTREAQFIKKNYDQTKIIKVNIIASAAHKHCISFWSENTYIEIHV